MSLSENCIVIIGLWWGISLVSVLQLGRQLLLESALSGDRLHGISTTVKHWKSSVRRLMERKMPTQCSMEPRNAQRSLSVIVG